MIVGKDRPEEISVKYVRSIAVAAAIASIPAVAVASDPNWRGEGWYAIDAAEGGAYGIDVIDSGPFATKDQCENSPRVQAHTYLLCMYFKSESDLDD
jgi:hypothetical protein